MRKFFVLIFIFVSLATTHTIAQSGILRGNVYDKATGQPVSFATVFLKGTTFGSNTDESGFFTISKIPNGEYTLFSTFVGYDSTSVVVKITDGIVYQSLNIAESTIKLQTVDISAKKEKARTEVQVSKLSVSVKEIKSLPSAGGEPDIAQYLTVLPGIVFTGDQGGQLYIRGGSPIQNKILLDGMTIYNPFHSIGFFSVFETEAIRTVDVLTGGFNATYGGRVSAIVDIKTKDGNKKRFSGLLSGSPFQTKFMVEGPIIPLSDDGGSSISYLFTGKTSLIDRTSNTLYKYAARDSSGLPYNYTDLYGKLSFVAGNGSKLNLFGFNFNDRVNYSGIANYKWNAVGGGANFTLIPSTSSLIIGGTVSYSNYDATFTEANQDPRSSSISSFGTALDFTYFGDNSEIKYGFDLIRNQTDFKFKNFLGFTIEQSDNNTEFAGFIKYRRKWGNLVIEPSFRAQYYASLNETRFEPRFGAKYNITDAVRLKVAGGLFSQNLISSVNERDIVNLFVGFLSGPEETFYKPNSKTPVDTKLQTSYHAIGGVEIDLMKNLELNIEPYYKNFSQLIAVNRNKLKAEDPNYATETGEAYGIDFSVKYDNRDLYLWATYSYGFVNRNDGFQIYPTIFDRRHNANLVATYTFGKNKSWEIGARWNLGSGFPFTLTQGFYSKNNLNGGIGTNVLTENPNLGIIYSDKRNSGRLPYYHRLDISIKKTIKFTKYSNLEVNASVTNAYDRKNIFYFDRVRYDRVNQLPIIPSLGMTVHF